MKRIPYQAQYKDVEGRPVKVQEENAEGELQWVAPPDDKAERGTTARAGKPKLRTADTYDMLREAMRALRDLPVVHKADDERRIAGVLTAIEEAGEGNPRLKHLEKDFGNDVVLGDKLYEWLWQLLGRSLPLSEEATKRGDEKPTFAWYIWRNNAFVIGNELRDRGDMAYVADLRKLADE
jgi:hypothetical protein